MAALAALLTAGSNIIKNFFEINTISIDNWTFKLFYKWSTTLFVFGSICVTHKQFFGDPILCDAGHANGGINSDVLGNFDCTFQAYFCSNNISTLIQVIVNNYPPKGRCIVVDIYRGAKRRGIYLALGTDPEGDSCFSIYQNIWL